MLCSTCSALLRAGGTGLQGMTCMAQCLAPPHSSSHTCHPFCVQMAQMALVAMQQPGGIPGMPPGMALPGPPPLPGMPPH